VGENFLKRLRMLDKNKRIAKAYNFSGKDVRKLLSRSFYVAHWIDNPTQLL
jgi:hypothetical protein